MRNWGLEKYGTYLGLTRPRIYLQGKGVLSSLHLNRFSNGSVRCVSLLGPWAHLSSLTTAMVPMFRFNQLIITYGSYISFAANNKLSYMYCTHISSRSLVLWVFWLKGKMKNTLNVKRWRHQHSRNNSTFWSTNIFNQVFSPYLKYHFSMERYPKGKMVSGTPFKSVKKTAWLQSNFMLTMQYACIILLCLRDIIFFSALYKSFFTAIGLLSNSPLERNCQFYL